ncbi:mitochondrial pyruvate carrier 2-like [Petromyzon marinus]|uniref:Mitochondrial pyruvate carrier n=1 Tax=Petromyzon marinus TaxID=7757 RepID=A0AAJ7THG6_PETMA|nr:mitochondrial pyruvate carrier 2-like [Petromyzon marinus]
MAVVAFRAGFHRTMDRIELILPQKFRPIWRHPAGPKTVFFWGPTVKWGLVFAGMADMARPAEKLSLYQNSVLGLSGFLWSRYSFVIIPKNINMFCVNFFLGCCGTGQLIRIFNYRRSLKDGEGEGAATAEGAVLVVEAAPAAVTAASVEAKS